MIGVLTAAPWHNSIGDIATEEATLAHLAHAGVAAAPVSVGGTDVECLVIGGGDIIGHDHSEPWSTLLAHFRQPGRHVLNAVGVDPEIIDLVDWSFASDYRLVTVRDLVVADRLAEHLPSVQARPCPATLLEPLPRDFVTSMPGYEPLRALGSDYVVVHRHPAVAKVARRIHGRDTPTVAVDPQAWHQYPWRGPALQLPWTHSPAVMLAVIAGAAPSSPTACTSRSSPSRSRSPSRWSTLVLTTVRATRSGATWRVPASRTQWKLPAVTPAAPRRVDAHAGRSGVGTRACRGHRAPRRRRARGLDPGGRSELMVTAPRVAVTIPTYNRADLVGDAIRSVLDQSVSEVEVFVSDNASTDDTRAVVDAFDDPRVHYLRNAQNLGVHANLSCGLALGEAPILCVLPDDDVMLPGNLETKLRYFDDDREVDIVHGPTLLVHVDQAGTTLGTNVYRTGGDHAHVRPADEVLRHLLSDSYWINFPAALIRRSIVGDVRFESRDELADDLGFFMRLCRAALRGVLRRAPRGAPHACGRPQHQGGLSRTVRRCVPPGRDGDRTHRSRP